jgi:hypothetical protein
MDREPRPLLDIVGSGRIERLGSWRLKGREERLRCEL